LSDNVGSHDFDLIKKLVFPEGKISDKLAGHEHVVTDFVWWDIMPEFVWGDLFRDRAGLHNFRFP